MTTAHLLDDLGERLVDDGAAMHDLPTQHLALVAEARPGDAQAALPTGATARPGATTRLTPRELRMFVSWLGAWPAAGAFRVVPSARRVLPGWDGRPHALVGVAAGAAYGHATVLSVPPTRFHAVSRVVNEVAATSPPSDRTELGSRLPAALGLPHRRYTEAVLRWTTTPAAGEGLGQWEPVDEPGLPAWLRPFGPTVLVHRTAQGRYLAGVGIKRHTRFAHEIAVGTAPEARNQGLARVLVAQAARRILDDGAVPLYLHDVDNAASARVAEAAGFPDRGWRWLGLADA